MSKYYALISIIYYALISIIYYALVVFISMMFIKNIFIYIFISVTAMLLGKYFVIDKHFKR